jgi:hypothetical protein
VGHKKLMESLKADPSGAACAQTVRRFRRQDRAFRPGTPDARMLDVIEQTCCRPATAAEHGAATSAEPPTGAVAPRVRRRRQRQRREAGDAQ